MSYKQKFYELSEDYLATIDTDYPCKPDIFHETHEPLVEDK